MRWLIKKYMCEQHIESIAELAKLSGMTRRILYDRINNPETLRLYEVTALDGILHFTDEDKLKLISGEM